MQQINDQAQREIKRNQESACATKLCICCLCNVASACALDTAVSTLANATTIANYIGAGSAGLFCCFTLVALPCFMGGCECDSGYLGPDDGRPASETIER